MPAVISDMTSAVILAMVDQQLRRRISPFSGTHPDVARQLQADLEELRRAGGEWRRSRISVAAVPARCSTEMAPDSADMEISPSVAAELLDRTDSRIRQLLRSGELPGRRDGRHWVIRRRDVLSYARKAAA